MVLMLLRTQQPTLLIEGEAWNHYFPYNASNSDKYELVSPTSFIEFLRYSLYRPRDIVTMLSILQENFIEQHKNANFVFGEAMSAGN